MNTYALVTGGISGIDRNLVEIFAEEGYSLILIARKIADLKGLSQEMQSRFSVDVIIIEADLSNSDNAFSIHKQIEERKLTIGILANTVAGQGSSQGFLQSDLQREIDITQYNIMSFIVLAKLFLPGMIERRHGKIISIADGDNVNPIASVYIASIAFLDSFIFALKNELDGTGVSVTSIRSNSFANKTSGMSGKTQSPTVKTPRKWPFMKKSLPNRDGYESFMSGDDGKVRG